MAKTLEIYKSIKVLRKRFLKESLNKESLLQLIAETEVAEKVYNSNAIENSTLSLEETDKILLQIDLDRFISERELFEAKNLARVITYISSVSKERELNFEMILRLHEMLLSNIRDEIAGRFRKDDEWVRVGNHIALDPKYIEDSLNKMLIDYQLSDDKHIVKRIAKLHLTFEQIHPFVDGNGRIGRTLNNFLLIKENYVPINIKFIDRAMYYDAFDEFNSNGKTAIMEGIVGRALTNSYHKRLAYLEGKKIITLNEYAKFNKISHTNLINKAKRQTIEAFLEKGVWKIGV
ncbi:Fic family protein [Flavobacteriales bacterium]|jgi:Fic family protein|nr:Fic family protein [Flavobacteriales bacterium]MDC3305863.1 Fic family protein [Flavobacteriales bacterium]MDC3395281.1 Fic family protein [Flavobacteriales bacterium]MDG1348648.1 Fic family protein [Flavobacteriales bacterium]